MRLAILGATGAVGREVIGCLGHLQLPCDDIRLLASERSAGTMIETHLGSRTVAAVAEESFDGIDYAIFAVESDTAKRWAQVATVRGSIVIDNSSAFRLDEGVPLVIPEINGASALGATLIASPNCTTTIAAMAVHPLYSVFGIRRMLVSTYQSASGAGAEGMCELLTQTRNMLEERSVGCDIFPHPIPFNLIPQIDSVEEDGYSREEMKVARETHKIFGDDSFTVSCTAVRIPVLRVHCESIVLETEREVTPAEAREVLRRAPGVEVRDDPERGVYPMPLTASRKFNIEVGRIRQNLVFGEHGLEFFVAGDQLLKGAALNTVQILQHLLTHRDQ